MREMICETIGRNLIEGYPDSIKSSLNEEAWQFIRNILKDDEDAIRTIDDYLECIEHGDDLEWWDKSPVLSWQQWCKLYDGLRNSLGKENYPDEDWIKAEHLFYNREKLRQVW